MINATTVALLIFAPAVLALAYASYSMLRFILSRRGVHLKNELAVGALGIFSIFAPKLLRPDSKKYFKSFLVAGGFFCMYSAVVVLVASVI